MKVPIISSSDELFGRIEGAFQALNESIGTNDESDRSATYRALHLSDPQAAVEYINYQLPELIVLDFSSDGFDAFEVMRQIIADPWLNHGGIIALYDGMETENNISGLSSTNIIISLAHREISNQFSKVLGVIYENQQILFQRAMHMDLISNVSGKYEIEPDISIISCYSNLIANYIYNLGFIDDEAKSKISLSLTELLINAIEHGTCGITSEQKKEYLEEHGSIHGLIAERARQPGIMEKMVTFEYNINAQNSTYQIRDEGEGFNWMKYVDPESNLDVLSFHGRGILLSVNSVSKLSYNDAGNEVTVSIDHRRNTTNTVPLVFRDREVEEFQPGDLVFEEGEESNFLYYIAEGEYRVEVEGKQVATVTPADILMGEMSFLLQESRSANVVANTPGKLIKISSVALINSIKEQPYYGLFLAKLLAQRLYDLARIKVR